jgi:hypothetical protein
VVHAVPVPVWFILRIINPIHFYGFPMRLSKTFFLDSLLLYIKIYDVSAIIL